MKEIKKPTFLHDLRAVLLNGIENPTPGAYGAAAACGFLDDPATERCTMGPEWVQWCGLLCAGVAAYQGGGLGRDAKNLPQIIAENGYARQAWLIHQGMDNMGPHLFRQFGTVCRYVIQQGHTINIPDLYNSLLCWNNECVRGEWENALAAQVKQHITG